MVPATGVKTGEGALRFIFKHADGALLENVGAEVYYQGANVDGAPIFGDYKGGLSEDSDGSRWRALAPGTYAVKFASVRGYEGPWNFNYTVLEGQETKVTFIVGQLTYVVRDADGDLMRPYVNVYYQSTDVNGNPIRGGQVTSDRVPETGRIGFNLFPGNYWVEMNEIKGVDWGQANNVVKAGTRTETELTLGRLTYKSSSSECVSVRGKVRGAGSQFITTDWEYASDCVDTGYGAAEFDLVPGIYAVKAGDMVAFDIVVAAGAVTEIGPSDLVPGD
jgi:hypothetical protein